MTTARQSKRLGAQPTGAGAPSQPAQIGAAARSRRGYTMMELLVAATIATTGLFAALNMTTTVTRGNTDLRLASEAQLLAEHIVASTQSQGMLWVDDVPYGAAVELKEVPASTGASSDWTLYNHANLGFSQNNRVGRLGNDTVWDNGAQLLVLDGVSGWGEKLYCVHFKMTRVSPDLARIEVRVTWARAIIGADAIAKCKTAIVTDPDADKKYRSVSLAGLIMRNLNANEIVAPSF